MLLHELRHPRSNNTDWSELMSIYIFFTMPTYSTNYCSFFTEPDSTPCTGMKKGPRTSFRGPSAIGRLLWRAPRAIVELTARSSLLDRIGVGKIGPVYMGGRAGITTATRE
jgi:hypothetical protein